MIIYMKLWNSPYELIKNGSKTIEIRLNDEKRSLIKIGDIIEFTNNETFEKMQVEVINLYKYNTFKELYENHDKISTGYLEDEVANYNDMYLYYSKEEEKTFGVLAIEIKLIIR